MSRRGTRAGHQVHEARTAERRARFAAEHPDVSISPPGQYGYWIARQAGLILAVEPDLATLLDVLDRLLDGGDDSG